METTVQFPVQFTEGAMKELKQILQAEDAKPFIRVGVKGGGCSGMTYVLEYDEKQEGDIEYEIDSIPVLMNKSHELYLVGMEIDFQPGLNSRGFTFKNPNASSTCGCGTSFAV
jgi:iron-sulfur cluster assembly accessory protein